MKVNEKLIRQVTETRYLNADNADRYRCIMRIFFEQYEKLRYWMYQEEVYERLKKEQYFADYTPDQCRQDLTMLAGWKNLHTMQDTRNISTLEEFKNKKFRYQLSEYSVEIERLILRLENLEIEGASLEPTLLERIRRHLARIDALSDASESETYTWWTDLNNDFVRLNQNYQDYMRDLHSVRAEEMMRTKAFLLFKDKLIEYLQSFIRGLQRNAGPIEELMRKVDQQKISALLEKVVRYERSIPRIDKTPDSKELLANKQGRLESMERWFGVDGTGGEVSHLLDATSDMIRRITRYAAQIGERTAYSANRRSEYKKIAELFLQCDDVRNAHKLSSLVFGLERPMHLLYAGDRGTDSTNSGVYEEHPVEISLKPRVRSYRERTRRSGMADFSAEKEKMREDVLRRQRENARKLALLEKDGCIDMAQLPVIDSQIRGILLDWIAKALERKDQSGTTQEGRPYRLHLDTSAQEPCIVRCEDGDMKMPRVKIEFKESAK